MANSSAGTSMIMCAGLAITYLFLPEGGPVAIYRTAAIGAALAIGLGIFLEARGVRSLVRTDIVMLVALFGLTLLEFFFPQEDVDKMLSSQSAIHGVEALFIAFSGLIIGRNFVSKRPPLVSSMDLVTWSPSTLFNIFVVLFSVGFFNMLMAVSFDPIELVHQMLAPRFSQPWQRARWGGLSDLAGVFSGLILYLVPAVAGAILAVPFRFTALQKTVVVFGLLFTLFYAFSSGTRNVFCVYLIIFVVAYILLRPNITWKRVFVLCCLASGALLFASYYMLQFRDHGLRSYVEGQQPQGFKKETLFIDQNLLAISRLTDVFPKSFDYLGSEFATFVILRPVPRALWPSKPYSLSHSAEDALGVQGWGWTVSTSFVGEAYMMGGYLSVLIVGLLLGALAGWWNRLGLDLRSHARVILYASGFLAALISMRSLIFTTTSMLPVVAIWLYVKWRSRSVPAYRLRPVGRRPHLRSSEQ